MDFLTINLVIGIVTTFLFLFRNPQSDFKYWVAVCVLGIFLTPPAFLYFNSILSGQILWVGSATGLLIFYYLRFKAKKEKTTIDYLKIPVLIMVILYPLTSSGSTISDEGYALAIINQMTFYLGATIIFYDRFIIKSTAMNRKLLIVLVAQTLLIGVFWVYGFIQKIEAERSADEAQRSLQISEQLRFENDQLKSELKNCR
jgi:hypothetical protein